MNRRLFFGTILGAFASTRAVPALFTAGSAASGGFVHFGKGTLTTLHGPEYILPLARVTDELLRDSAVDFSALVKARLATAGKSYSDE